MFALEPKVSVEEEGSGGARLATGAAVGAVVIALAIAVLSRLTAYEVVPI